MKAVIQPVDAAGRQEMLRQYDLLDSSPDPALDDLAALAAHLCEAPIALITIVTQTRQWSKAQFGWPAAVTTNTLAFCTYPIRQLDLFVVHDAQRDARFSDDPLVSAEPHLRFYAGVPLVTTEGQVLGTLCVLDRVPRQLSVAQQEALRILSSQAITHLALRQQARTLADSEMRYRTLFDYAQVGIVLADDQSYYLDANASACQMFGYTRAEFIGLHAADIVVQSEVPHIDLALAEIHGMANHLREWQFRRKDGSIFPADVLATKLPDGKLLGTIRDISDRKQANDYRQLLAAIVESSRDAIISKDLNGSITSWNAGATAIFGYTADEMIGTSILRLIPDNLREEENVMLSRLRNGERIEHFDTQRRTRDGRLIDVSIAVSTISDAAGRIIGAAKVARDVTALKEHERELARLSRLYDALSQVNQAIVCMPTREKLFEKICQVLVERGGFAMTWIGWHDDQARRLIPMAACGDGVGYLQSITVHTHDRPEDRGISATAFVLGRPHVCNDLPGSIQDLPWSEEVKRRGFRSAAAFPIRLAGAVCATLSVCSDKLNFFQDKEIALLEEAASDVSFALDNFARQAAHQLAEENMRDAQRFSDTMIESMPGILYFFDANGRFLRWNKTFETVSGYSAQAISAMHPLDFFHDAEKPQVAQRIAETFTRGESSVEAALVSRDGAATPYFFTGRRVMFNDQLCLVGVGIDISEREKRHRAEAADRIKSAFLATMSHELRTPLNSIIGFSGILLKGLPGPLNAEQTRQLNMVLGSARHLLELISDVLDISKIEAGQLEIRSESFDMHASIERVVGSVKPLADKKGLLLITQLPPQLPEMIGDRRRVEQILLNLLNNAIKFSERGQVTLTVASGDFQLPDSSIRPAISMSVADTGIGIAAENMALLFQPFRQLDTGSTRQHEGTGLGLAICQRLAELLGGRISAKSQLHAGSEFTVVIPLRRPDAM